MADVAGSLVMTQDLDTGIVCVYERLSSNKMSLVREFPSWREAQTYIKDMRRMYSTL